MTLFLLFPAPYRWPSRTPVRRAVARVTVHSYGSGPLWERVAGVAVDSTHAGLICAVFFVVFGGRGGEREVSEHDVNPTIKFNVLR